jgi:hypothetical protein
VTSPSVAQRKHALIERSSLARMRLRRDLRALRVNISGAVEVRPLFARIARGLFVAKVAIGVFKYLVSRVRNRTDAVPAATHHGPSTGELQ